MAGKHSVDLDRGVITRFHPAGWEINMYVDQPGVYFDHHLKPVDERVARQAGFDTERYRDEKEYADNKAIALRKLDESLARTRKNVVVEERGGFKLVQVNEGMFIVKDAQDRRLTPSPASETVARALFDELAGGTAAATTLTVEELNGSQAS